MARLRVSAGMLTALASSKAALRRMFPLGPPPPIRAAVVISRSSFEKSFPRCWSFFAFLRLIWAHFEWPDIRSPPRSPCRLGRQALPQPPDALEPRRVSLLGGLPVTLLDRRRPGQGRQGFAAARPQLHEPQVRGARVPHLAGERRLGQHLEPDLPRARADAVQRAVERHHLPHPD